MFVDYKYLEQNKIVTNRMCLARAIELYGFPKAVALGANRLAWHLDEVEAWISTRPRRTPKTGAKPKKSENPEGEKVDTARESSKIEEDA